MIHLPRGVPVKEKINPARVNLPEAMQKLGSGGFSGYLRFDAKAGVGIIVFENGRLVSALYQSRSSGKRTTGNEGLEDIFGVALQGHSVLNIYRVDSELVMALYDVLYGDYVYQGLELEDVDIQSLLDTIRKTRLTGCLRVYTDKATVLVFYREGESLGFFHEGAPTMQTTADLNRSVARMPGARMDLLATRSTCDDSLADLMAVLDLPAMWEALRRQFASRSSAG
ncbi:MAG: hypothetical protein C0618_06515 [Desulfuromonas sp.]|nr:MAG: hypothetical protein C0618_06515 [Desulfuromonas sp.]